MILPKSMQKTPYLYGVAATWYPSLKGQVANTRARMPPDLGLSSSCNVASFLPSHPEVAAKVAPNPSLRSFPSSLGWQGRSSGDLERGLVLWDALCTMPWLVIHGKYITHCVIQFSFYLLLGVIVNLRVTPFCLLILHVIRMLFMSCIHCVNIYFNIKAIPISTFPIGPLFMCQGSDVASKAEGRGRPPAPQPPIPSSSLM